MHKKNLIHRDIKAENILLSSKKEDKSTKSKKFINPTSSTSIHETSKYEYLTKICDLGFTREED
jgi:serine/threonine protein kinase